MSDLIAFEGLDQSGKETQASMLRDALRGRGVAVEYLTFPDYTTPIGRELERALLGERAFGPDVMQLLFIANRYERREHIAGSLRAGTRVICDRYVASSVAYGEGHGLDPTWLADIQRFLPPPALTILLDIEPAAAARRKSADRDRYERDLALLARVRESYLRQARQPAWVRIDGARPKETVAADVLSAVTGLGLP
ncbi:MAG TPA: dTMP kinase [Vicinamibacterales bacterium]|nr:dTMP kinase [Vicinamibacterales bacterium]